VVGPQFNLRSDHQGCNGYARFKNSTVGGAGSLIGLGGGQTIQRLVVKPATSSGLTSPGGGQRLVAVRPPWAISAAQLIVEKGISSQIFVYSQNASSFSKPNIEDGGAHSKFWTCLPQE
jgi:hypothetical protein